MEGLGELALAGSWDSLTISSLSEGDGEGEAVEAEGAEGAEAVVAGGVVDEFEEDLRQVTYRTETGKITCAGRKCDKSLAFRNDALLSINDMVDAGQKLGKTFQTGLVVFSKEKKIDWPLLCSVGQRVCAGQQ